MNKSNQPYVSLGSHLKYVREQAKQSLEEVSGAVEIEQDLLARIEAGMERPDEDVLMLLISHFKVQDGEAVQLWELADYESEMPEEIRFSPDPSQVGKQTIMLLAMDIRTLYSDSLDVVANSAGATLSFGQSMGPNHTVPIARIGMSLDQTEQVIRQLEQVLLKLKYGGNKKLLPPSSK